MSNPTDKNGVAYGPIEQSQPPSFSEDFFRQLMSSIRVEFYAASQQEQDPIRAAYLKGFASGVESALKHYEELRS